MECVTSKQISDQLDLPLKQISKCSSTGYWFRKKYKIIKVGEAIGQEDNTLDSFLMEEWNKARAMFKNVVWVKKYEYGVKRLGSKKVG